MTRKPVKPATLTRAQRELQRVIARDAAYHLIAQRHALELTS